MYFSTKATETLSIELRSGKPAVTAKLVLGDKGERASI